MMQNGCIFAATLLESPSTINVPKGNQHIREILKEN